MNHALTPCLDLRAFGRLSIMRYLPDSKKGAKTQDYERKEDGTDDLAEIPSDLIHSPLASFVKVDHS